MKNLIAAMSVAALMGVGISTVATPAEAAYVTTSTHFGPHGVTEKRVVHSRFGSRAVSYRRGFGGRVCRKVVSTRRTPMGVTKSVRTVCN